MRLRNLEEELGIPLIERRQRFEGFTAEGERLLSWAKQTVSAFDGLKTEAHRLQGQLVGTLRIGMVPLSHVELMPQLQQLRQQSPQIRFQLHSLSSQQIVEQLENNQLDIGLTYLSPVELTDYHVHPLGSPDVGLLSHPQLFSPADDQPLRWSQLAALPLGLLSHSMRFRQGLEYSARQQGVELQPVLESDSVEHLLEATNAGLCCTLMPLPLPGCLPPHRLQLTAMQESLPQPALAMVCRRSVFSSNALVQALLQRVAAAGPQ